MKDAHMSASQKLNCPLCQAHDCQPYCQDKKREYWQCQNCHLVFVPQRYHLSVEDEKAEYDKHDNSQLDDGYRRFLNRTLEPLLDRVSTKFSPPVLGLDFGCGEGAFLSQMAREQGVEIANYDLFYHPDKAPLSKVYDFIVMTEVLEHLFKPHEVFLRLLRQLKPGGILAIMTKRVRDQKAFTTWHYKNDPTHICYYSETTFEFIARQYSLEVEFVSNDVVFLYAKT